MQIKNITAAVLLCFACTQALPVNEGRSPENAYVALNRDYKRVAEPENAYVALNRDYKREPEPENAYVALNRDYKREPEPENAYVALNRDYKRSPISSPVVMDKAY